MTNKKRLIFMGLIGLMTIYLLYKMMYLPFSNIISLLIDLPILIVGIILLDLSNRICIKLWGA